MSELLTFKFLTLQEAMVTQISLASSSPNFYAGKCLFFFKKSNSVYFKVGGVGILGIGFCIQGSH